MRAKSVYIKYIKIAGVSRRWGKRWRCRSDRSFAADMTVPVAVKRITAVRRIELKIRAALSI